MILPVLDHVNSVRSLFVKKWGFFLIKKGANANINTLLTVIRWLLFCFHDTTALDFT